jgi:hypothetical protein
MKSIKKTLNMPFSFFIKEFKTLTHPKILDRLRNGTYSGKINDNRFILKCTSGRNLFKKNTYATIQIFEDTVELEIFFISELFSNKLLGAIFILSFIASMMEHTSYLEIITGTIIPFIIFSSIPLALGLIAQVFPAYHQKQKTNDFILSIEKKYEIHCLISK